MSSLRKKIKTSLLAGLSLTLCATHTVCTALAKFNTSSQSVSSADSLPFTDVTGQFDTTGVTTSNFNSSVLEGVKTTNEVRTLIVSLSEDSLLESKSQNETVAEFMNSSVGSALARSIKEEQKNFINKLNSHKIKFTLKQSYSTIANAVAIEANTSYISEIKSIAGVESVVIGQTYLAPQTVDSASGSSASTHSDGNVVYNDSFVYPTGIYDSSKYGRIDDENDEHYGELQELYPWGTGEGTVVAVIDTGLDYTHNAFQQPLYNTSPNFSKTAIADRLANTTASKRISALGGSLSADDVYVSDKVPFAFDYADTDADVYPSYSNHGTHVAGIIAGNDPTGYDDKNGNHINTPFKGVAPDAQLVICKTFTDNLDDAALGGAESENIMAALEDCVTLGVDVINMSLGSTAGFTSSNDDDDEGKLYNKIFNDIQQAGISLICAASNDYSAGFGSVYGTNLATNPDSGTVGSPSSYYAALSVASISGQESQYMLDQKGNAVFFENANDGNSEPFDFVELMLADTTDDQKTFEYVVLGSGQSTDYAGTAGSLVEGRIALIQRGGNTFQQKVEYAVRRGAIGVIVYNNVPGTIRMSLGDIAEADFKPAVSISMDAGKQLVENARSGQNRIVGTVTVSRKLSAGPFMSAFSSWGTTPDLKIKPEITAHGGEITSTVPGGYAEQSGTSMASPNMAGLTALVRNYIKTLGIAQGATPSEITQLTNQFILSTATTAYDETNLPYSPRKQGSGLANLDNIINTKAYVYTDKESDGYKSDDDPGIWYQGKDGRPKIELGDGEEGKYTFSFKVRNFGSDTLTFTPQALFMTEQISSDKVAVAEKAEMLDDIPAKFFINNAQVDTVAVLAGQTVMLTVTLELSDAEKKYITTNFTNGMFVEGFIKLNSANSDQCGLTVPFLSFYGDWEKAPMLDYDAFYLAQNAQDTSIDEDQKLSATVWATQPYASYNNDQYVIPMGSYVYTQDPNPDLETMYANMEYCAISRYNEYNNEEGIGNYMTTYNFRCVYAGLLRNARRVNYKLYDSAMGVLIKEGHVNRISKAYANGGSARPAYVELKLTADELGLLANGKYRFDFEFLFNNDSEVTADNTFSFDFYVDYEAPILQDARLRYYNYRENNKDKQRIYLDLDIYDNHYAQSVMLLYRDDEDNEVKLNLATDYITPVRNPVKNGVSTVSIEVTDIWEEYKDRLYVQIDDYALNHANYMLGSLNGAQGNVEAALNTNVLPDTFELAPGEENITIDINEAHKISLVYDGNADLSNFIFKVTQKDYIAVKNGEIVGLKSTQGRRYAVTVSNGKGVDKVIQVTVTDKVATISNPDFGFNIIRNSTNALTRAKHNGYVSLNAGQDVQLEIVPDPWYYPMDGVTVTWSTTSSAIELD
ncbi:MAG: S8 family serine peptidase, partial [Clostridia bacterium]|nr:S8 family serine peptidase [Clostridia bacterium]